MNECTTNELVDPTKDQKDNMNDSVETCADE